MNPLDTVPPDDVLPAPHRRLNSPRCGRLVAERWGVLLHYDGSTSDPGAEAWFRHPDCRVSYQRLYLDDGVRVDVAPWERAAWHAGTCLRGPWGPYPNSAFYGLAAATSPPVAATRAQVRAIAEDVAALFRWHGWGIPDLATRLLGHHEVAVFPEGHRLAGRLGRKVDPIGPDPAHPVLDPAEVRALAATLLRARP